jgi:hypothetical protein
MQMSKDVQTQAAAGWQVHTAQCILNFHATISKGPYYTTGPSCTALP